MVSWSALGRTFGVSLLKNQPKSLSSIQNVAFTTTRILKDEHEEHEHETFVMRPSRWQWHKFKDMFHFYLMVGLIPVGAIIFYANVFIGPAKLTPIPPNYEPKHWEYHRHPITRFIAQYIHHSPQEDYEKFMHFLDEEAQKIKLLKLEKQIIKKMEERQDYQAYYYRPMVNKYLRINKKIGEEMYDRVGDDYKE